jgi:hypothetical protein
MWHTQPVHLCIYLDYVYRYHQRRRNTLCRAAFFGLHHGLRCLVPSSCKQCHRCWIRRHFRPCCSCCSAATWAWSRPTCMGTQQVRKTHQASACGVRGGRWYVWIMWVLRFGCIASYGHLPPQHTCTTCTYSRDTRTDLCLHHIGIHCQIHLQQTQ